MVPAAGDRMKRCSKCGETKPRTAFNNEVSRKKDGLQAWCKECHNVWKRTPAGRKIQRRANLRRRYDLSLEDFHTFVLAQGGSCALPSCGRPATNLDHDHAKRKGEPGFVRGILCHLHNAALGAFNDDPVGLADAIAYLRGEPKERPPSGGPESPTVKLD
jgi:hypothetical protein